MGLGGYRLRGRPEYSFSFAVVLNKSLPLTQPRWHHTLVAVGGNYFEELKMSVVEKVIIVTGAGSGIGKATALLLGEEKAKVALFDINPSIFDIETQIKSSGGTALAIKVDVSSSVEVDAATKAVVEAFGPIDGKLTGHTKGIRTILHAADRSTRRRWCQLGRRVGIGHS